LRLRGSRQLFSALALLGKDIPYPGLLNVLVSAVWSVKASNAGIIFMGDCATQVLLK
jgi:hypothetical protein